MKFTPQEIFATLFRLLKEVAKSSPRLFFGLFLCIILTAVIPFISQFIDSKVIDEIVKLLQIDSQQRELKILIYLIVIAILINLLERTVWVFVSFFEKIFYFKTQRYFVNLFMQKAASLDSYHYENSDSNKIIQKARDIYDWKPREVADRLLWMISDTAQILSSIFIIINFSFLAFLLITLTTIPNIIVSLKYGKSAWGIWDADAKVRHKYYWTKDLLSKEEVLSELRIFGTRSYLINIVQNTFDAFMNKEKNLQTKRTVIESIVGNLPLLGISGFWVLAIFETLNGNISIGLLTFYVSSMYRFSNSLSSLFRSISKQYEEGMYIIDLFKFFDLKNNIKNGTMILHKNSLPPQIEFKNVDFVYPDTEKKVLENFSLVIKPGEKIALVGVNGAGKSTIIKLLCRFYDVTGGAILIDGVNIKEIDSESLYKKFGILFQTFVKYRQFDVKTNIELGDIENIGNAQKLTDALIKSDSLPFVNEYKHKTEQILDKSIEDGIDPSGGQWQKIALARAIFRDAPILILDEPTSAIDAKSEQEIFNRIYEFANNKTVIIISHRFSTVRKTDRIVVIESGKIIEHGSHNELLKLNKKYAAAFLTQAMGYR